MDNFDKNQIDSDQDLIIEENRSKLKKLEPFFPEESHERKNSRNLLEKIYSTIDFGSKSLNYYIKDGDVNGDGNLLRNYNNRICKTTLDDKSSFQEEYNEDLSCLLLSSYNNTPINFRTLNLTKKESLITLIKHNREINGIVCPFDEIFYFKTSEQIKQSQLKINILNVNNLEEVDIMPMSVSTYLMPFFFDIFQPSLLKSLPEKTLEILLKLKCEYQPKFFLNSNNLVEGCILNDILWNCFALFNYKFSMELQLGFLNYYFAVRYFLKYFDSNTDTRNLNCEKLQIARIIISIKKALEFFVEALILTGFFNRKSFNRLTRRISSFPENEEFIYLDTIEELTNRFKILRLADLCRIQVKSIFKNFSVSSVKELKIPVQTKDFLLFDKEFSRFYNEIITMF